MRIRVASLLAAAISFGAAQAVSAADMPAKAPVYKAPVPVAYNWTGCYLGANVGGGWTDSSWDSPPFDSASPSGSGAVAGGQVGCNYQLQRFVLGVEGDLDWSGIKGDGNWIASPGFTAHNESDYLASIRGRLGLAFNQWLVYGTGGVAWANWQYRTPECAAGVCGAFDSSKAGWVAGGGVEYMFRPKWTGRVEFLYYDFGNVTSPAGGVDSIVTNIETSVSVVRVGLSYMLWP